MRPRKHIHARSLYILFLFLSRRARSLSGPPWIRDAALNLVCVAELLSSAHQFFNSPCGPHMQANRRYGKHVPRSTARAREKLALYRLPTSAVTHIHTRRVAVPELWCVPFGIRIVRCVITRFEISSRFPGALNFSCIYMVRYWCSYKSGKKMRSYSE